MKAIDAPRVATLFLASFLAMQTSDAQEQTAREVPRDCAGDPLRKEIPGFTEAVVDFKPIPQYPKEALNDWSEGWVLLEHAITAQGEVRDIAVIDAVGPKDFVTESIKTISKWRYKPATRNGQPVEQSLYQASVTYVFSDSGREADHRSFVRKYNQARREIQDNQFDAAIATLEAAFKARLNHYEQAMGSFVLGLAYSKKGDWPRALFHIRHAVIQDAEYLERPAKKASFALLVELEARNGNLEESICAFQDLKKADPEAARPGGPLANTVANIESALAAPGPIAIDARLAKHPLIDAPAVWRHQLLRSKFSFDQIAGEVKSFRLVCVGTTHEAPVEADIRWDVPAKAGACIIRVDGAPGATFRLIEEW